MLHKSHELLLHEYLLLMHLLLLLLEDLLLSLELVLTCLKLCKVCRCLLSLSCLILLHPLKDCNQSGVRLWSRWS